MVSLAALNHGGKTHVAFVELVMFDIFESKSAPDFGLQRVSMSPDRTQRSGFAQADDEMRANKTGALQKAFESVLASYKE